MKTRKALFLDRDGVININYGYVHAVENFHFIDGIFDLARLAFNKGYHICIITNQSGIGRGYYSESQFLSLTSWMCERFKEQGAIISKVYFSPYHPVHGIGRYKKDDFSRKPNPGMLIEAINDFNLDPRHCIFVGDNKSDIYAGLAAKIGTNIYLSSKNNSLDIDLKNVFMASSLQKVHPFLSQNKL